MNPLDDEQEPAPVNKFEAFARREDQAREQQMRGSFIQVAPTNPDRAAEAAQIAIRQHVPVSVVEQNFDRFKAQDVVETKPYQQIANQTPHLARNLAKPEFAAVAKDDLESLGALEWLVTAPQRAFAQGLNQINFAQLRHQSLFRDLTQAEKDQLGSYRYNMEVGQNLGAGVVSEHMDSSAGIANAWFRGAVTQGAQQLPIMFGAALMAGRRAVQAGVGFGTIGAMMGPAAPFTAAAGFAGGLASGALVGAAEFGMMMESGLAYDEFLATKDEHGQPMDPQVAKVAALTVGAINAALEAGGEAVIAATYPGVRELVGGATRAAVKQALLVPTVRGALGALIKEYAGALTAETATEVAQRAVTIVGGELAKYAQKGPVEGQLAVGNVDLYKQPAVTNPDGSISTVDSVGVNIDGREVLLPTVTPDGRHLAGAKEAEEEFRKTGLHLGQFSSVAAAEKFGQQLHQDYAAGVYKEPGYHRGTQSIMSDLGQEALGAIQAMVLPILPGPIMGLARNTMLARQAQANGTWFKALAGQVEASKTVARMPQAAQDLLQQATKDGPLEHVYAPTDTFGAYWQSKGIDPEEMATAWTGDPTAWQTAIRTGEPLQMKTADYAVKVAGTEHHQFFAEELKLGSPQQMNVRESEAFIAEQERLAKVEAEQPAAGPTALEQLTTQIAQRFEAAGESTQSAQHIANLHAHAYLEVGRLFGLEPAAVYTAAGVAEVQRPDLGVTSKDAAPFVEKPTQPAQQALVDGEEAPSSEAKAPSATFLAHGPDGPLYNVVGGEADRSTVSAARLEELGIPVPETPEKTPERLSGDELRKRALAAREALEKGDQPASAVLARLVDAAPELDAQAEQAVAAASPIDEQLPTVQDTAAAAREFRRLDPDLERKAKAAQARAAAALAERKTRPRGGADAGEATAAGAGDVVSDRAAQQPVAGEGGTAEGAGAAVGAQPGGVSPALRGIPKLDEVFERESADVAAARLTPEVTRELDRMIEEMEQFPYEPEHWNWDVEGLTGNAAGGHADRTAAKGGAEVFTDVLGFSPVNLRKGQPADKAHGSRAKVLEAMRSVARNRDITSNLQEGAVRVAEQRNSGDYRDLSTPSLPPRWGVPAARSMTDALLADLDTAIENDSVEPTDTGEAVDFNPLDFGDELMQTLFDAGLGEEETPTPVADRLDTGELQPRVPGTEEARRVGKASTTFRAPVQATSDDFTLTPEGAQPATEDQGDLFQLTDAPKGYKALDPHLTDQERADVRRGTAKALVEVIKLYPRDSDYADVAEAGRAKRGWYADSVKAIRAVFGEVDAPRFVALLAALSPRVSVEQNLENTVTLWVNWQRAGRPQTRKQILTLAARSVRGKNAAAVLDNWKNNAVRALTADDPSDMVLSGPKVQSFSRNLMGHAYEVTNDAWMAAFALVKQTLFAGRKRGDVTVKGAGYLAANIKARRAARILTERTGETWTPAEVQETIWSWSKTLYELSTSTGKTAEEIVRNRELTDQMITATPAFAQLLVTNPEVRAILEAGGYGQALDIIEQEFGDGGGPAGGESGAAAAGTAAAAGQAPTAGVLRSARRLDELRRQRQATSDDDFYQLDPEPLTGFYSRLVRTVQASTQPRASGAQWKATIRNSKIGINRDEFALASVDDLEDGTSYTQQQVLDYLAANTLQVQQVRLADTLPSVEAFRAEADRQWDRMVNEAIEEAEDAGQSPHDLYPLEPPQAVESADGTWEAMLGEENVGQQAFATEAEAQEAAEEQFDRYDAMRGKEWRTQIEQSLDYSEAERFAHEALDEAAGTEPTRYSDYVLPGLVPGTYQEVFLTVPQLPSDGAEIWSDGHDEYDDIENPIVRVRMGERLTIDGQRYLFLEEVQPPHAGEQTSMPTLLKKNWRELAFKWALREAASRDLAGVAWTTGDQQADRYSLSKQVERITWTPRPGGARAVHVKMLGTYGDTLGIGVSAAGQVIDVGDPRSEEFLLKPLSAVIGEELADQVLEQDAGEVSGEGLKVGGAGLKRLYNVDFANVVNGLPAVKKHGGRVEQRAMAIGELRAHQYRVEAFAAHLTPSERTVETNRAITAIDERMDANIAALRDDSWEEHPDLKAAHEALQAQRQTLAGGTHYRVRGGIPGAIQTMRTFDTKADAEAWLRLMTEAVQPALPLTPPLRDALMEGQALFQEDDVPAPGWDRIEGGDEPANVPPGPQARGAYNPQHRIIRLFARANPSTILHETGHHFLHLMTTMAAQPDAPTKFQADTMALLRFGGWEGDLATWNTLSTNAQRDVHERVARGFEAYLFEGRAPSRSLRASFATFRAWLLAVYRTVRGMNVEINPEVRGVFDRLLASETAIQQAEQDGQVEAMFLTAEQAGMSPERFALYRSTVEDASRKAREKLDRKLLAEVRREQTRVWQEQRDAIRATVVQDLSAQPAYKALAAIRRGTNPDGSPLDPEQPAVPLRLSRAILLDRYGQAQLRALPRGVASANGGLDPDFVATAYGFPSGSDLLTALAGTIPFSQAVENETGRRMLEAHGSLLLDGSMLEEGQAAVANEDRETVIRAELRALGQLRAIAAPFERSGRTALQAERKERAYERRWLEAEARLRIAFAEGRKQAEIDEIAAEVRQLREQARGGAATIRAALPSQEVLRAGARARIAASRVGDIQPERFWWAARDGSRRATEAAARQDFDGAIQAKQQELINTALFREATRVREAVEKRTKAAQALDGPQSRKQIGTAGHTYQDQIDAILDQYEFAAVSQKALRRRADLRLWVAGQLGENLPVDLPEEVLQATARVNYRELTVEEFMGVTDALQQIAHLARLKNRLLKSAAARTLEEATTRLSSSIRAKFTGGPSKLVGDRRPSDVRRGRIDAFFAQHRKLSSLLRELDGFEDGGPATELIMFTLNAAANEEARLQADGNQRLSAIVERAYPGSSKRALYDLAPVPAVGRSMSRMQKITVALNWGNEGNRQRIRDSFNWTDEQVTAVMDSLPASDLTFVQEILDLVNSYWPQIEAKQKRVYGVAPDKVEASPITTRHGTIPGGYYPLKYDDRLSIGAVRNIDLEQANFAQHAAYTQATTRRGHTKGRLEMVNGMFVRSDFGVIFEHLNQVVHDLSHHEALIDVGRILGHRDVGQAILDTYGKQFFQQIRDSIKDVAFGTVPAQEGLESGLNHLRQGATVVGLAWNFTTAFMQPLGLTNSMFQIGPRWVARGLVRWLRDPTTMVDTVKWIEERSAFMKTRGQTQQREINEVRQEFGVSTGRLSGWVEDALKLVSNDAVTRHGMADSYFWAIQQMQRVADVPTWLGQYEKAMAAEDNEARAIQLADQAVLDSQGGGQIKDLSHVQRGNGYMKLWTNFYSFFNLVHQQHVEAHGRARQSGYSPAAVGRLGMDYMLLFIIPAVLGKMLRGALRPGPEGDDDSSVGSYVGEIGSYLAGTMLGFRELAGVIQGSYGYEGPAGARIFSAAAKLVQQTKQGELDWPFYKSLLENAGILFHVPTGQIRRTLEGIAALIEGKTQNPMALATGAPKKAK